MTMKKMKICRFTILEMLVAMGLLSVIMFALLSMLDQSQKAMTKGVSQMDVVEEARAVLDQIENDVTCVDYKNAVEKDRRSNDPLQFALNNVLVTKDGSLELYTTRAGRLPRFCKVLYRKSGHNLIMETKTYDEKYHSWVEETDRTLLTNVLAFNVDVERYSNLGEYKYPKKVTIELQLLDDETRKLGYKNIQDAEKKKINEEEIKRKIGTDAYKARAARFSRVVSLEPPESISDSDTTKD
ncbi:MAG: hypothetical protein E7038_03405 [Lentisphaerae bacterium]|nr:hypothetical protein [Lentisphaerota bacterium]